MALWAVATPELLAPAWRRAIETGPNYLSVIGYWEVIIKTQKGNLEVGDPSIWWADTVSRLAARVLPLRAEHVAAIYDLPLLHRDPFDRALVAQALVEDLTLVSKDRLLARYAPTGLRLIQ